MKKYDYLIVGSGLFGSVFAYEMTKRGKKSVKMKYYRPSNPQTVPQVHVQEIHYQRDHQFHYRQRIYPETLWRASCLGRWNPAWRVYGGRRQILTARNWLSSLHMKTDFWSQTLLVTVENVARSSKEIYGLHLLKISNATDFLVVGQFKNLPAFYMSAKEVYADNLG